MATTTAVLAADLTRSCLHADLEYMGNDGPTSFQKCHACGSVVIGQGGQTWVLRPRPS